jgi:hypothetical protein
VKCLGGSGQGDARRWEMLNYYQISILCLNRAGCTMLLPRAGRDTTRSGVVVALLDYAMVRLRFNEQRVPWWDMKSIVTPPQGDDCVFLLQLHNAP